MRDVTPRPVQGHDEINSNYYCHRCAYLPTEIKENWTNNTPDFITMVSVESLQADCALCAQFCRVFEWIYGSFSYRDHVYLYYLLDSPTQVGGMTIGLKFESYYTLNTVELFPIQSTEFAHPQVVRRIVCPDEPDYQFIRKQVDICKKSHGQECIRGAVGKHVLRVIDCKSRRLIAVRPDEPYACLSYVWGSGAARETQSFGDELPAELPKTIEDAMAVAIALEVPFLWVDRYCIDQENLQEKHNTIQNMNRVYEGAEITIIAACGDDPHHGLPGVRGTPRKPQLSLTLPDTTFLGVDPIFDEIGITKWAERGWTYQEMLLSRRRLVFTNTQMYFQCRTTHCMESLHPSFTASTFGMRPQLRAFPFNGVGYTVFELQERLTEYYSRQLSFDTDVINAFKGIISAYDQLESFPFRLTHFYGVFLIYKHEDEDLAQTRFVSNLCWAATRNSSHDIPLYKISRMNLFPSFSWASTKLKSLQGCFHTLKPEVSENGLLRCDQIQVRFTHRTDGDMNLWAFIKHKDSYEMFLPLIKLTTWIVSCPLSRTHDGMPLLFGYDLNTEFQPEASCKTLHLAYLGAQNSVDNRFWIFALVLEEVEPGVFRRIGRWNCEISWVVDARESTGEILNTSLSQRQYEFNRLIMDFDEEAVSQSQWERRTVTIV
ncbi:hypothetical protein yc1106_00927 [Curvularia clavata]|uniref:Heterokaryon incompatibility domain-containing protein n=1 Tax=Curvularia clavata TaxID=95742 RepID=A0A9Q8Z474_CURCL|nr:hypothetical protein yc1106_00927 [Curvularia clavata]